MYALFPDGHVEIIEAPQPAPAPATASNEGHGVHNTGVPFTELLHAARDYRNIGWPIADASRLALEESAPYRGVVQ